MFISFFKNLFSERNKCSHAKLTPFSAGSFCPDCGSEIEISWIVPRCECCNARRKIRVVFNSLHADDKYCIKCGNSGFYTEKKETLEIFDVEYAVISKKEVKNGRECRETLQVWVEDEQRGAAAGGAVKFIPVFANAN